MGVLPPPVMMGIAGSAIFAPPVVGCAIVDVAISPGVADGAVVVRDFLAIDPDFPADDSLTTTKPHGAIDT